MKYLFSFNRPFCAVAALLFCTLTASAQLAYTRSTFSAPFTSVSNAATTLTFSSNTQGTTSISLPFPFTFTGTTFTTSNYLAVTVTGSALLSTTSINNFAADGQNNHLYDQSPPYNLIAPYWDFLTIQAVGVNPAGSVRYETTGISPNRVITVEWYASSYNGLPQPKMLNFQLKLYETTNIIEFWYNSASGAGHNSAESASIGIKDGTTGGPGHYIDVLTGSGYTGNACMNSLQFPKVNFRLTPTAPTPLPGGTYTVGIGQTYPNISEAFADINQRGISGSVTLTLVDASYDTTTAGGTNIFPLLIGPVAGTSVSNTITISKSGSPAVISWGGVTGTFGVIRNQHGGPPLTNGTQPIVGVVGGDYITMQNLDLHGNVGSQSVDYGLCVLSSSSTNGAQNNSFQDISVTLRRANLSCAGIYQLPSTVPANNAGGANSGNSYKNLVIKNCFYGITLTGSVNFPDNNCQVGTTSCGTYNVIGDPLTADDIGNGLYATYGIRLTNQSNVSVFSNRISNVKGTLVNTVDGIWLDNSTINPTVSAGVNQVYGNEISSITATDGIASGIRATLNANAGSSVRIYNNTVTGLNSSSTSTTSRRIIGIRIQEAGGGSNSTFNIDFNSVRLEPSNTGTSNACFEIGGTSPVTKVRNNIFANFTSAQTGAAKHYCWVTTSSTSIGGGASASNYNDLYTDNATNGFTALSTAAPIDYTTLANWQSFAAGPDANSIAVDPSFTSPTDLHAAAFALDNAGNNTGITWVSTDMDCQARPLPTATNFDIGADEFIAPLPCAGTPTAGTAGGSPGPQCGSGIFTLTLTGNSSDPGITYQWQESLNSGGPYVNCSVGSGMTTPNYTTGMNTMTVYYVCLITCTNSSQSVLSNEVTCTVNPLPSVTLNFPVDTICLNGGNFALNGASPAGGSWSGTGVTGSSLDPLVHGTGFNLITYMYTDVNGCTASDTQSLWIDVCNGMENASSQTLVLAYPNPTNGLLTVRPSCSAGEMEVTTIDGKIVFRRTLMELREKDGTQTVDLSAYADGIYYLKISGASGSVVLKIVKCAMQ